MYLSFFLNIGNLKECCEAFMDSETKTSKVFLMFTDSVKTFIAGISAFRLFRETGDQTWLTRGRKHKELMKHWTTEGSEWNFKHKLNLMEAEDSYCQGNIDFAKEYYKEAIACARSHKFINDEGEKYDPTKMVLTRGSIWVCYFTDHSIVASPN
jgi:hypothetical protein